MRCKREEKEGKGRWREDGEIKVRGGQDVSIKVQNQNTEQITEKTGGSWQTSVTMCVFVVIVQFVPISGPNSATSLTPNTGKHSGVFVHDCVFHVNEGN